MIGNNREMAAAVLQRAREMESEMAAFLREMIAIPSESGREGPVVERIGREMKKVGFDEVVVDGMGNILGRIGSGGRVIAMDAHIDTVGVGDPAAWSHDPFKGKMEDGVIYGRGASDQEGGMASMVYAGRIVQELGLAKGCTLWVVGSVQEEDCDGLCWQYILREGVLRPEVVVLTEPTNLGVYRGHRGRMEIGVTVRGRSCHGSAPERGINAVYRMARVIGEIEKLNERLATDPFLGKGTVTVSHIESNSPSLCAVPDRAYIHLDRRLTVGETEETAAAEVRDVLERAGVEGDVEVLTYAVPSYTGLSYPTRKYYPTWVLPESHAACRSAVDAYQSLFGHVPRVDKWTFSTNGVATMGMFGIPTVGFGPANEIHAHAVSDQVPVEHLVKAAAFYALFPSMYCSLAEEG
jgi:putative selenium metabolism hydrolase